MGIWDEFAASDAYKDDDLSNIMVIFGGTGDLAKRKIFPALYHLLRESTLPEKFAIVAIGRRQKNNEEYREYIYNFMKKELNIKIDEEVWSNLSQRIYYLPFKFE